jgi:hypothetical protein
MEQFLAEQTSTSEDVEKVAQAEFFLKLAHKNGIDLNSLTDSQVNELWSATFSKTAEEEDKKEDDKEKVEKAKEEHEKAKESAAKVAEAEMMGRVMAESYVNHLQKIASEGGLDFSNKAKEEEKTSSGSYLDDLACRVALQKVAQAGLDVDAATQRLGAVLTLGPAESEKIAHVHQFGDAVDVRSSELLEMAGYPIDWSGTPFDKEAGAKDVASKAWGHAKSVAKKFPGVEDIEIGRFSKGYAKANPSSPAASEIGHEAGKTIRRGVLKATATGAGAAAAGYGGYRGIKALSKKKDEGAEKDSSANFDLTAAQCAVEKAASVGWNADEAVERLNAVLTLGPGDPATSEKVAAAQTEEQALEMRACELLELAGYPITWN